MTFRVLLADIVQTCKEATGGNFSDLLVRENDFVRIRTTRGLEAVNTEAVITRNDILEFLSLVRPNSGDTEKQLEESKGELNFGFAFEGDTYRGNVAWYNGRRWLKLAMRKLDKRIRSFPELGLPESLAKWLLPDSGLILVVGPTGSGKSSTLASFVERLNQTRRQHILTIEDPIEFRFEEKLATITQREVGPDTDDFAQAARNALREDPDVIMIGEIRDLASAREALRLSETGHLVLASLHADSAVGAVARMAKLMESAAEQAMLLSSLGTQLIGVIFQRLVVSKKLDTNQLPLRVLVYETLTNTPAVSTNIRENKIVQIPAAVQMAGNSENQTNFATVLDRLMQGSVIDKETADRAKIAHDRSLIAEGA